MTAQTEAKATIQQALRNLGLPPLKLTARTVSFQDLARADCIVVKLHGWAPNPAFNTLQQVARAHGLIVEA